MIEENRKIRLIMALRRAGVSDTAVLAAIERVAREKFIPDIFLDQAYDDVALPIGLGQTISQPSVVAFMTQELQLNDRLKVLEIGTGSGYQTAILARLCRRVYSIEIHEPLLRVAESRLADLRIHNVTTRWGDGARGWQEQAPFDRIILTCAAAREVPQDLLDQLAIGGRMMLPLTRPNGDQILTLVEKGTDGVVDRRDLWPVRFVPLLPADAQPQTAATSAHAAAPQSQFSAASLGAAISP